MVAGHMLQAWIAGPEATPVGVKPLFASANGLALLARYLLCAGPELRGFKLLVEQVRVTLNASLAKSKVSSMEESADAELRVNPAASPLPQTLREIAWEEIITMGIGPDLPAIYFVHPPGGNALFTAGRRRSLELWDRTQNELFISWPGFQELLDLGEDPQEMIRKIVRHAYSHLHDARGDLHSETAHDAIFSDSERALLEVHLEQDPDYIFHQVQARTQELTPGVRLVPIHQPEWLTGAYTERRLQDDSAVDSTEEHTSPDDDATRKDVAWFRREIAGTNAQGLSLAQALAAHGWTLHVVYQPIAPLDRCAFGHPIEWKFIWVNETKHVTIVLGSHEMMSPLFGLMTPSDFETLKQAYHEQTRELNRETLLLPTFFNLLRSAGTLEILLNTHELRTDPTLRLQAMGFARLATTERGFPLSPIRVFEQSVPQDHMSVPLTPEAMLTLIQLMRHLVDAHQLKLVDRQRIPSAVQVLVARMALAQRRMLLGDPSGWREIAPLVSRHLPELGVYHENLVMLARWLRILRYPSRPSGLGMAESDIHTFLSLGSMSAADGRALAVLAPTWNFDLSRVDYIQADVAPEMLWEGESALRQMGAPFHSILSHIGDVRNRLHYQGDDTIDCLRTGLIGSLDHPVQVANLLLEIQRVLKVDGYGLLMTHANLPRSTRQALRAFGFEIVSEADPELYLSRQGMARISAPSQSRSDRLASRFRSSYLIVVKARTLDAEEVEALRKNSEILAALAGFADVRRRPGPPADEGAAQPTDESLMPLRLDQLQPGDVDLSVISRDEMTQNAARFSHFEEYLALLLHEQEQGRLRENEITQLRRLVESWDDPTELVLRRRDVEWALERVHEEPWRPSPRRPGSTNRTQKSDVEGTETDQEPAPSSIASSRRKKGPSIWELYNRLDPSDRHEILQRFRPHTINIDIAASAELLALVEQLRAILPEPVMARVTPGVVQRWLTAGNPETVRIFLQTTDHLITPEQLEQTLAVCHLSYRTTTFEQRQELRQTLSRWAKPFFSSSRMDWAAFKDFEDHVEAVTGQRFPQRITTTVHEWSAEKPSAAQNGIFFNEWIAELNRTLSRAGLQLQFVDSEKTVKDFELCQVDPLRTQHYFIPEENSGFDRFIVLEQPSSVPGNRAIALDSFGNVLEFPDAAHHFVKNQFLHTNLLLNKNIQMMNKIKGKLPLHVQTQLRFLMQTVARHEKNLQSLDHSDIDELWFAFLRRRLLQSSAVYQMARPAELAHTSDEPLIPWTRALAYFDHVVVRPESAYFAPIKEFAERVIPTDDIQYRLPDLLSDLFGYLDATRTMNNDTLCWTLTDRELSVYEGRAATFSQSSVYFLTFAIVAGIEAGIPAPTIEQWRDADYVTVYLKRVNEAVRENLKENPHFLSDLSNHVLGDLYHFQFHFYEGGRIGIVHRDATFVQKKSVPSESDDESLAAALRTMFARWLPAPAIETLITECLQAASSHELALVLERHLFEVAVPAEVAEIFSLLGRETAEIYRQAHGDDRAKFQALDRFLLPILIARTMSPEQFTELRTAIESEFGFPLPVSVLNAAQAAITAPNALPEFIRVLNRDYLAWRGGIVESEGPLASDKKHSIDWITINPLETQRVWVEGMQRSFDVYVSPSTISNALDFFVSQSAFGHMTLFRGNIDFAMGALSRGVAELVKHPRREWQIGQRMTPLQLEVNQTVLQWTALLTDASNPSILSNYFSVINRALSAVFILSPSGLSKNIQWETFVARFAIEDHSPTYSLKTNSEKVKYFGILSATLENPQQILSMLFILIFIRVIFNPTSEMTITNDTWQLLSDLWTLGLHHQDFTLTPAAPSTKQLEWLVKLSQELQTYDNDGLKDILLGIAAKRYRGYIENPSGSPMRLKMFAVAAEKNITPTTDADFEKAKKDLKTLIEQSLSSLNMQRGSLMRRWRPSNVFLTRCLTEPPEKMARELVRNFNVPPTHPGAPAAIAAFVQVLEASQYSLRTTVSNREEYHALQQLLGPLLQAESAWEPRKFAALPQALFAHFNRTVPDSVQKAFEHVLQMDSPETRRQAIKDLFVILNGDYFGPLGFIVNIDENLSFQRLLIEPDVASWTLQDMNRPVKIYRVKNSPEDSSSIDPRVGILLVGEVIKAMLENVPIVINPFISEKPQAMPFPIDAKFAKQFLEILPGYRDTIYERLLALERHMVLALMVSHTWANGQSIFQPDSPLEMAWHMIRQRQSADDQDAVYVWARLEALTDSNAAQVQLLFYWFDTVMEVVQHQHLTGRDTLFWFAFSQMAFPARAQRNPYSLSRWMNVAPNRMDIMMELGKRIMQLDAQQISAITKQLSRENFRFGARAIDENHLAREEYPLMDYSSTASQHGVQVPYSLKQGVELIKAFVLPQHGHLIKPKLVRELAEHPLQAPAIMRSHRIGITQADEIIKILKKIVPLGLLFLATFQNPYLPSTNRFTRIDA